MYISPFACGIVAAILAEIAAIVVYAIAESIRAHKKDNNK